MSMNHKNSRGRPSLWRRAATPEDMVYQEIGWLRILGWVGLVFGAVCIVWGLATGAKIVLYGVAAMVVGLLLRAFGGIWATLERIARK